MSINGFSPGEHGSRNGSDFYAVEDDTAVLALDFGEPTGESESDNPPTFCLRVPREGPVTGGPQVGTGLDYHCHVPREKKDTRARNQLMAVSVLCFLFMVAEIIGGYFSQSIAILTDATHLASDLTGFLISLLAVWVGQKPPTMRLSFGFYRAEVLGALSSVFIIWVATGVLVYLAVDRVVHPDYNINADDMLITAGVGVAFNIIMGIVLHSGLVSCPKVNFAHGHSHGGHGHSHGGNGHSHGDHGHSHGNSHGSHGDSHDSHEDSAGNHSDGLSNRSRSHSNGHGYEQNTNNSSGVQNNKKKVNINVRAAFIHVIGDFIQSIGVLIAAVVIKLKPEYKIADPICTFVFSVLVLFTTVTILKDAVLVLMEAVPKDVNFKTIKRDLGHIQGVKAIHSLHVWALTMEVNSAAVHLAVDPHADWNDVLKDATTLLRDRHSIKQSTIQVELYDEATMMSCDDCKGPKMC